MSSLCDRLFLPVVTLGVGVERVGDRVPRYVRSKAHGDGAKHDDLSACKGPIMCINIRFILTNKLLITSNTQKLTVFDRILSPTCKLSAQPQVCGEK